MPVGRRPIDGTKAVYIRNFPKELRQKLAMAALEKGMTIRELVIMLVEQYLKGG